MSVPNCSLYSDALSATPAAITGIVTQKDPVTKAAETPVNSLYGTPAKDAAEPTPRTPGEVNGAGLASSTLSALLGFAGNA
jgi:hypothetical protein